MANGIATLDDVAKLANVCKATASRILGARKGQDIPFSDKTQLRVREAARMLDYRPSKLARGLSRAKSGIVGLVIPSVQDSFFPAVTAAIEAKLAERGLNVILCNTHSDVAAERARIEDLMAWRVDGLVIAPSQGTGDASLLWELRQRQVPFVLIDRDFPETPFHGVTTDDYAGATAAVEHLLAIGRGRIARAGGPLVISTNRLRHAGYVETLLRHGILPDQELALGIPPTEEGGREAARRFSGMSSPPDALFCFSDPVAVGVMEECLARGIRIPEDLALVGYGDLPHSGLLKVSLTTVRQPCELIGRHAAEMLLSEMDGKPVPDNSLKLPVELIVRDSTVPARAR